MNLLEIAGTQLEVNLVKYGFNALTIRDKNDLTITLADRANLPIINITEEYIMNRHKEIKINMLAVQCEEDILNGFTMPNGHTYRTNRDDQMNMLGQKEEINSDPNITQVPWKTEDAGYVIHTREEWLAMYSEAFKQKKAKLFKYDTLKKRAQEAKTDAELIAIQWEEPVVPSSQESSTSTVQDPARPPQPEII